VAVKIRERPLGSGIWWLFIDHQGKRKSKKIGKDKRLAREVAKKIEAKLTLGEFQLEKLKPECPTFKEYAEIWLGLPHDWKESTWNNYKDNLRLHAYPVFRNCRLNEISRKDLKAFFDKLLIKGLHPSTVVLIRCPISGVLSHAMDSELIESNPLKDLQLRYKKKALDVEPLAEKEVDLLLKQIKKYLDGFYYPPVLCALRTGMRIGEIQALQWGDVDFNGRFIEVRQSWRKKRLTDTKSKKRRRVDMTAHLAETLKNLRVVQKKRALKQGRTVSEWVFADKNGKILNREMFKRALNRCLDQAGLRSIRVHDLRHSYATIRLLRGHNIGDVSYQLGHSSISITYDTYGHWMPGRFKSEVDELDNPQQSATYPQPNSHNLGISKSFQ